MGKPTGFMDIEKVDRGYKPVSERISNYKEFVIPLTKEETIKQAARCMECGVPYCHNGCPVNNQIPDWNDLVYSDDWKNALENLHSTNIFPELGIKRPEIRSIIVLLPLPVLPTKAIFAPIGISRSIFFKSKLLDDGYL